MPSDQNNTSSTPAISLHELYDSLMAMIEPELTLAALPSLESLYQGETEEEWKQRSERYEKAFALFEERFGKLMGAWGEQVLAFKKDAMRTLRNKASQEEKEELSHIERSIGDA